MTVDNSTAIVTSTESGTGWTLDVTNANLDPDLTLKDFIVQFDGITQNNTDFTKLSRTSVQFTGSDPGTVDVEFFRDTPITRIQEVTYGDRMTSDLWEDEFNRVHRILAEEGTTPGDQNFSDVTAASLAVTDLTDDRVLIAGTSGEVEDDANLTYDGTDLSTNSLIVTDLTNNRVLIAGSGGAVEDDSNLTYNGTVLSANAITSPNIDSTETIAQASNNTTVPTTAWVRDAVGFIGGIAQGRLSIISSSPFSIRTGDTGSESSTIYYNRYNGAFIGLHDGSSWQLTTIPTAGVSLDVSGLTNDSVYDVFLYDNGGTLTLDTQAWATNQNRGDLLDLQDGIPIKDGDSTRRYVGCIYINVDGNVRADVFSNGDSSVCELGLLNYYNRIQIGFESYLASNYNLSASNGAYEVADRVGIIILIDDDDTLISYSPPPYVVGTVLGEVTNFNGNTSVNFQVRVANQSSGAAIGNIVGRFQNSSSGVHLGQAVTHGYPYSEGAASYRLEVLSAWSGSAPTRRLRPGATGLTGTVWY